MAVACGLALLFAGTPAAAQEVFAWFNRDLLPVHFQAGDWVRYAVEEVDELGPVTDTLTVTVIEADTARVWLELRSGSGLDYLALDPGRLEPGRNVLDALIRVVRTTDAGLVDEDVAELRESALVQRHFADPFREPRILRRDLPDTLVAGTTLPREEVRLEEVRREAAGPFVVVTSLSARAELSADLPLVGILDSRTLTTVTTEAKEGGRGARRPPLVTEHSLHCIGFGQDADVALPALPD